MVRKKNTLGIGEDSFFEDDDIAHDFNDDSDLSDVSDNHGVATEDSSKLVVTESIKSGLSDSMSFTLSCEVGSVNLSINELSNLKIGDSLNLISDLQHIKIKINSVVVGFGALVDIDGRYGIKITKMLTMTEQLN